MLAYISTCNPILTSVPQTGLASILEILRVVLSFYERNMELFNMILFLNGFEGTLLLFLYLFSMQNLYLK